MRVINDLISAIRELAVSNRGNDVISFISIILGVIGTIASAIAAFCAFRTARDNRKTLIEMENERLISTQNLYPLLTLQHIFIPNIYEEKWQPDYNADIQVSEAITSSYRAIIIRLNNGNVEGSQSYCIPIPFELVNNSQAVITAIKICYLAVQKPTSIEGHQLHFNSKVFDEIELEILNVLLRPKDSRKMIFNIFVKNSEYVKYLQDKSMIYMEVEIKIITGIMFYESFFINMSEIEYNFSSSKGDLKHRPIEGVLYKP